MKITKNIWSTIAARQIVFKFNKENGTNIDFVEENKEGVSFVTFDLKNTPQDLVFEFAFTLGDLQHYLEKSGTLYLPPKQYPFPVVD